MIHIIKLFNDASERLLLIVMMGFVFILPVAYAEDTATNGAYVDTTNAVAMTKVAPGELLPISVKLSNFGGGKRVDVFIKYTILASSGDEIYSMSETAAVETTASFVKTIQIPFGTTQGMYTAKTSVTYEGQLVPATTQFSFTVERKYFGLFKSAFLLYGGVTIIVSGLTGLIAYLFIKRNKRTRFTLFDYSHIPRYRRIFFEILSDTIVGMRERVGDQALDIASNIEGLTIDEETGKVLTMNTSPAKIIATLVSEYEELLHKKVSFSLRKEKTYL